jgi:hypothetical protein
MEYLKIAQDLEMYGVNYFNIKVKKWLVWNCVSKMTTYNETFFFFLFAQNCIKKKK